MSLLKNRTALQVRIGYTFQNERLLESALSHPSTPGIQTSQLAAGGYERLEFLGDRVLGLAVASLLLEMFPKSPEGELAKRHTALVRKEALIKVAKKIDLISAMELAIGEGQAFARQQETTAADGIEALIGAIFLDGGYESAGKFVRSWWQEMLETVESVQKDPKTTLQEWAQANGLALPEYSIVDTQGPAHQPNFSVTVFLTGQEMKTGYGRSKRLAEQAAATKMLAAIEVLATK
jgi:ribonuclease-3